MASSRQRQIQDAIRNSQWRFTRPTTSVYGHEAETIGELWTIIELLTFEVAEQGEQIAILQQEVAGLQPKQEQFGIVAGNPTKT